MGGGDNQYRGKDRKRGMRSGGRASPRRDPISKTSQYERRTRHQVQPTRRKANQKQRSSPTHLIRHRETLRLQRMPRPSPHHPLLTHITHRIHRLPSHTRTRLMAQTMQQQSLQRRQCSGREVVVQRETEGCRGVMLRRGRGGRGGGETSGDRGGGAEEEPPEEDE